MNKELWMYAFWVILSWIYIFTPKLLFDWDSGWYMIYLVAPFVALFVYIDVSSSIACRKTKKAMRDKRHE